MLFFFQKPVAVTEENTVAALLRRVLGAAHQHWEKRVGDIGNDYAQRSGTLVSQALGQRIGAVVQFDDGRIDTFLQRRTDVTLVIDDRGDGENGYSCFARYIINRSCFTSGCP